MGYVQVIGVVWIDPQLREGVVSESLARIKSHEVRFSISPYVSSSHCALQLFSSVGNPRGKKTLFACICTSFVGMPGAKHFNAKQKKTNVFFGFPTDMKTAISGRL
jgi:hypothetical protein